MKLKIIITLALINLKIFFSQKKIQPYKVLLQLTNDCNSRCQFCHIWKINPSDRELKKSELHAIEYNNFLESYGENIYWLSLSGGEISLYNEIDSILENIKKNCPKLQILTFTTNGLLPEEILRISLYVKKIFKNIYFFVTISLDGDQELHNQLRGVSDNYERAQLTYKLLYENNINTYWGLTLNNLNAKYFSTCTNDNFKAVSISHDGGIYNLKFKIDNQAMLSALKNIIHHYKFKNVSELFEYCFLKLGERFLNSDRQKLPIPCASLQTSIHISPNGDVLPCMFLPALGNIKNGNFIELINNANSKNALAKIKSEQCPKCWMNCYGPHSMIRYPLQTLKALLWK